jgi:hypothetical protein
MSTIITRNSATSGSTPSSLVQGELAINVTDGRLFYGSGSGNTVKQFGVTSSYALNALSSSYALTASFVQNAVSASYALNGGVTQLLAGPNVTLSPTNGLGQVTVSAILSGSTIFNTATGSYGSFYDTTTQTNPVANIARSMSFNSTDITNGVSISGSTSPFNTYIKTTNAGIYNIQFSAQVEKTDSGTDVIVIWLRKNGIDLTDSATKLTLSGNGTKVVAAWNWFVPSAANDYYQIIWVSADTGMRLYAEPINDTPGIPSVILTVNRVDQFLSNTGSFSGSFTGVFTGSLQGTASFATQALSSSFATTASYVLNGGVGSTFPYTGSALISGSLDITGSLSVLNQSVNSNVLNTNTYTLRGTNTNLSLDWDGRTLNNTAGTSVLSWRTLRAFDTSTTRSIDWGVRTLNDTGAITSLDWSARKLYDTSGTGVLSADWRLRLLHDASTSQSLDWTNRIQIDAAGITSTEWDSRRHYDTSTSQSIDWESRDLTDINESASLNWSSRIMRDSGAPGGSGFSVSSIDWENRQAYDTVGNVSIDWSAGNLTDTSGNPSINWIGRSQYDSTNNSIIDYSGNNGRNIANYRPTIEISSPTTQDEFIATTTGFGSIASNFAGKLIEVGPNIDLAVTASNTVFLDTDGVWKLADQSTDNTTKLLGICTNGYVRGAILIDGIVTVTTSSAIIDVPYVRGSNFYGMPVYLTGSQSSLTTTKPTSGYVRVIGHMYYNSPTTPDYWIMKFNPSNDWYEI